MNMDYMSSLLALSKYLPMTGSLSSFPRLLFSVLKLAGLWKMFDKAGIPGWSALIPFYSLYCEVKMAKKPESFFWWLLSVGFFFPMLAIGVGFLVSRGNYINANYFRGDGVWAFVITLLVVAGIWAILVFIMSAILKHAISKAFGHGVGMALGLVFLPIIFYPILGFGSSQYQKEEELFVDESVPAIQTVEETEPAAPPIEVAEESSQSTQTTAV